MLFMIEKTPDRKPKRDWQRVLFRVVSLVVLVAMLCSSSLTTILTAAESAPGEAQPSAPADGAQPDRTGETASPNNNTSYTIYFAAPQNWAGYTVKANVLRGDGNNWQEVPMTRTGETYTYDSVQYNIYSAYVTEKYGGFDVIQFRKYNGATLQEQYVAASSWVTNDVIQNKIWVPNGGGWREYQPDSGGGTARRIYFDATFSKLSYAGSAGGAYSIPAPDGTIRYYATGSAGNREGSMTKAAAHTVGGHTWNDVYYVDLPEGYNLIVFSSFDMNGIDNLGGHGESTGKLTIPSNLEAPCFYPDTGDKTVYDGGQRGGYWAECYTVQDAAAAKNTDVVDITREAFAAQQDTMYLKTTFYDYYTDYELNGSNRDTYTAGNGMSQRNWVPFRQLNQALSEAYKSQSVAWPLYVGHFQPSGKGGTFDDIAGTLNLYGHTNRNYFYASNNSLWDADGGHDEEKSYYAMQGLIHGDLVNGNLMASGGALQFPLFNEGFLRGENSKNAVLGEVYKNVSFPFTKKDVANNGVEYWVFDSRDTTLAMRQDPSTGAYYLKDVGHQGWSKNVNASSEPDRGYAEYGFFPFNATSQTTHANTYNYGYGLRIDQTFRLTENGTVLDKDSKEVPIEFNFAGDDDMWIFIDGKLALDVGGDHGAITAKLNFQTKQAEVQAVKKGGSADQQYKPRTTSFTMEGENTDEHTLTLFFMERGMWGSNLKITFNFPDENQLEVEKQVDTTAVNDLFKSVFDSQSLFTFSIKNLATHYGAAASQGETYDPISISLQDGTAQPSNSGNQFDRMFWQGKTSLHWHAGIGDDTSTWRHRRYGVFTMNSPVDVVSHMDKLSFDIWYDADSFSLNDLYLQLVDADATIATLVADQSGSGDADALGCIGASSRLSGKTYGAAGTASRQWVRITLDLDKLDRGSSFDRTRVKYIRFGCNNAATIYLAGFKFEPEAEEHTPTGFVSKQYDVPDYGSSATGSYQNASGAVYTSNLTGSKAYVVDADGRFVLESGEILNFHDQFRRGSYIYLEEVLSEQEQKLYTTSWTMYEDDVPVGAFGTGSWVTNPASIPAMVGVSGTLVSDGRTERLGSGSDPEGHSYQNGNSYNGVRPSEGGFVFRSYRSPDSTETTTKIKAVFTNVVNTGSLTVAKAASPGITGTYTFYVQFYDVGGLGLEAQTITTSFTLSPGKSHTIDGIPVGTQFSIYEVNPSDDSFLEKVTTGGETLEPMSGSIEGQNAAYVTGTVSGKQTYTYTFTNASRPVVSLVLTKRWVEGGAALADDDVPATIFVTLQRRQAGGDWETVSNNVAVRRGYQPWSSFTYTFRDLDKYVDYTAASPALWEYRVLELDESGKPAQEGGKVSDAFTVSYGAVTPSADGKTLSAAITNTREEKLSINVTKRWTYQDGTAYSAGLPELVQAQVQRSADGGKTWAAVQTFNITKTQGWQQTISDLPKRDASGAVYTYRVVELDASGNALDAGSLVSYSGTDYVVSYDPQGNNHTITNSMRPSATLSITKRSAVDDKLLAGVVFRLEKLTSAGEADTSFPARELTTDADGVCTPAGLKAGTYRLTETKAANGYALLSEPITVVLTQTADGRGFTATVNGVSATTATSGSVTSVECTVYNKPILQMPQTGGAGGLEFWILGGLCITAIPLLLYYFTSYRKGGKQRT